MRLVRITACAVGVLVVLAAEARAQDAGVDAGLDAGVDAGLDAGPDAEVDPDGCGDGPPCGVGLDCLEVDGDLFCGLCRPGETRSCDAGCGEGISTCEDDLFWGRCDPEGAVECSPGDSEPCESACGPGTRMCDPSTCRFAEDCIPNGTIQCIPGASSPCELAGGLCSGNMVCDDRCLWGSCLPPDDCHACGDGRVDEGEECDEGDLLDGDGCSSACLFEEAQPFRSCDCTTPGTTDPRGTSIPALLAAAVIALSYRRRFR